MPFFLTTAPGAEADGVFVLVLFRPSKLGGSLRLQDSEFSMEADWLKLMYISSGTPN